MTSLFSLVPYYPPWDRSKKSVYQATLLCQGQQRTKQMNAGMGLLMVAQPPEETGQEHLRFQNSKRVFFALSS